MYLEGYMAVRGGNFLSGPSPRPIKIALIQFPITCFLWIKQEFLALKHKNGLSWLILKFCFPQRNIGGGRRVAIQWKEVTKTAEKDNLVWKVDRFPNPLAPGHPDTPVGEPD